MATRSELHAKLEEILGSDQVYYQPPESIRMRYPAIVYNRSRIQNRMADNTVYNQHTSYDVTIIDPNPDSEIVYNISLLKYCTHDRHYTADGLNHDVFTIYI